MKKDSFKGVLNYISILRLGCQTLGIEKSDVSIEKTVDERNIYVIILIVYVAGMLYYIILTQSVEKLEGLKGG